MRWNKIENIKDLPKEEKNVLVSVNTPTGKQAVVAHYDGMDWIETYTGEDIIQEVSHWASFKFPKN